MPDGDITVLLQTWSEGDPAALKSLVEQVYPKLKQIAGALMRNERNQTLSATVLVHELYLKLSRQHSATWQDRRHFFAICAQLMRRILIDAAKHRNADKRDGIMVPLSPEIPWLGRADADVNGLERALERLGGEDDRLARVLELRAFLGCTSGETAEILAISKATVDRDFALAKSWLFRELRPAGQAQV